MEPHREWVRECTQGWGACSEPPPKRWSFTWAGGKEGARWCSPGTYCVPCTPDTTAPRQAPGAASARLLGAPSTTLSALPTVGGCSGWQWPVCLHLETDLQGPAARVEGASTLGVGTQPATPCPRFPNTTCGLNAQRTTGSLCSFEGCCDHPQPHLWEQRFPWWGKHCRYFSFRTGFRLQSKPSLERRKIHKRNCHCV